MPLCQNHTGFEDDNDPELLRIDKIEPKCQLS